jgi:hypothetical protein
VSTRSALLLATSLAAAALLAGCGIGPVDHSTSGTLALQGIVFGGQQPVTDAKIQLYTVGSSGNASPATAMIPVGTVKSGYGGNFSITGDYTCGQSSSGSAIPVGSNQVYIVATDGNPGLTSDNPAMVLMAAIGDCSKLATTQFIEINEVTTAAAAWALAPFITSYTNVGATSTNTSGITNAFLDAALLADTSTGLATTFPSDSNLTVESNKLYALANSIASCVNSEGSAECSPLFLGATPTNGTAPSDTLSAALNIVQHPGENVNAVYLAAGAFKPFPSAYTKAPNDWTMSLSITGGGLVGPQALAIDADSNVWVTNLNGPLSAFGPQGAPLSSNGFGAGDVEEAYALAVDSFGDIWVDDYNASPENLHGGVTKFMGSGTGSPGTVVFNGSSPFYYDPSLYYSVSMAADTVGNIYIANNGDGLVTEYDHNGAVVASGLGGKTTYASFPAGIALDSEGGFWLPDGDRNLAHYSSTDALLSTNECCSEGYTVATDSFGDAWVANFGSDSISEVSPDNTLLIDQASIGGIYTPEFLAIDAAQNVWVSNYYNHSISEIASYHGSSVSSGTAISPSTGIYGADSGGYGLDAGLNEPITILPDRSGNIWVANEKELKLVMFFGLATPTVTPLQSAPTPP